MKKQRKILHIFAIMLLIAGMSCSKTEIEDMNEFKKNEIMAPPGGGGKTKTWHYDCYLEGLPEGEWGYWCQTNHLLQSSVCTECFTNDCAEKDQCYYTHS